MPWREHGNLILSLFSGVLVTISPLNLEGTGDGLAWQFNQASAQSDGNISEKEAFDSAKELGTIEAWEAYLMSFPSGFRADLARAYVRRLGSARADAPLAEKAGDVAAESFNCPEGIPLVVEFLNSGSISSATVSIDGSPKTVLKNVESGSGSIYSNGEWTLHVKGDTAIISTPSGEDVCTQNLP